MTQTGASSGEPNGKTAYRAQLLYFTAAPGPETDDGSTVYCSDGMLLVEGGCVVPQGDYQLLRETLEADITGVEWRRKMILAGVIDTHITYPDTAIIDMPTHIGRVSLWGRGW